MIYADLVFLNGNIITLEAIQMRANALAARAGRIIAVSSNADIQPLIGKETTVINLAGKTVIPGFHDAHCHILEFGLTRSEADLRDATDLGMVVQILSDKARQTPPGEWVRGSNYNQNKLAERRHPSRADLDAASSRHPIFLLHVSGHMAVVNSRALELAGITRNTRDPEGGVIERDASGEPTGLLKENAQALARRAMPPRSLQESIHALATAGRELAALGITSAQDAWAGWMVPAEFRAYQQASAENLLPQRVRLMPDVDALPVKDGRIDFGFGLYSGFGTERLKLGAVKFFLDGSLIGRTAALSQPYANDPETRGFLVKSKEKIAEQLALAHQSSWQVAMHAIGDYAIEVGLDVIESVMGLDAARCRPRIEHCGVLRADLIERIRRLGVVIVTQPRFVFELGDGFRAALGAERLQLAYPFASLRGLPVAFSSDAPVVHPSPLYGIRAAVEERTAAGAPYVPSEAISVVQGLRWYTLGGAYSTFEENENGSLVPGKWADLAVLSRDPLTTPLEEWDDLRVLATVIGGRVVYGDLS